MTDADRLGFLAAICAEPERDDVRLVYADYLEEHGDPLGEFIRVQVALYRKLCPAFMYSCHEVGESQCQCRDYGKYDALRRRERELLDAHRGDWFRLLCRRPGFGENEPLRWWPVASNAEEVADRGPGCPSLSAAIEGTPRRGFVASLTLTAEDFLAHADALLWRPGEACRACGGHGYLRDDWFPGDEGRATCHACRGAGTRPCPPTAQPIETVAWTTAPSDDVMIRHGAAVLARPGQTSLWTFASWPGVEFTLP